MKSCWPKAGFAPVKAEEELAPKADGLLKADWLVEASNGARGLCFEAASNACWILARAFYT